MSAWIEMIRCRTIETKIDVALLVSAWIEITVNENAREAAAGRTPRECVD